MDDQIETLPVLQRLALAYAPRDARERTLALFALDNRLAGIVRAASEPMLAQIRLAWWRELLVQDPEKWTAGEPLLALLRSWGRGADALSVLVDGWEHLVGTEPVEASAIEGFIAGRASAFSALARQLGHEEAMDAAGAAGGEWALADLAARLQSVAEFDTARALIAQRDWSRRPLPRPLRPLAVLHGLAVRAAQQGEALAMPTPRTLLSAIRIGLFGR